MVKKILIIVVVLLVVAAVAIVGFIHWNKSKVCTEHIDNNADGKCDICGETMAVTPPDEQYNDAIEAISKYSITAAEGESFRITAPKSVIKGNSFTFDVVFSNYFDSTNAKVCVNGIEVTPDTDGKYTVSNVLENVEITVSGLVRTHYGVAKLACLGARVIGDDKIEVGGSYSFTLDIADSATGEPVVKANGEVINAVSGVYTVSNVDNNLLIEVSGLTVPLVNVSYADDQGYTVESEPTIVGESLRFSIHIGGGHENHVPLVVKVNGAVVESVDGIYTVENAPKDVSISVEGLNVREKITLTFENCDLEPISIYKATAWQEVIPTREGYVFNGWEDILGYPISFDYMSDVTLYASWITEDGVDYIEELPSIQNKIKARYTNLGGEWWKLNALDKQLADQYTELLGHHTEFERGFLSMSANVDDFIARTAYVSANVVSKNAYYGANENAVRLFYTVDGMYTNKGASNLKSLSNGDAIDGVRYNIQEKNGADEIILDYVLSFGAYDFKSLCETEGKVTFWLATNATGLKAQIEGEYLFDASINTAITSGGSCALYRIDIQDGMLFVNTEYAFDLSETVYRGESELSIKLHRLNDISHQYAYIEISDIYAGAEDPSLVKVLKTSETFKITNMLSASYIDPVNGLTSYTRSDVSSLFSGDKYNIQKPSSGAENLVLEYKFTISPFNYQRYCEKYGSVSFKIAAPYTGTTVSIASSLELTLTADTPLTVTIQDGSIFVDGVYICDLAEDVYNGTSALVMDVSRQHGHTYAAFHVSDLTAGPANAALVKG